jgi:hypothetical protein
MNHDELDRLISREAEIIPSSGFTASVMTALRAQAHVPPAITFPWKRALPGIVAAAVVFAWALFACIASFSSRGSGLTLAVNLTPAILSLWHATLWLLLALVASVVSLALSYRLVSRIA